MTTFHRIWQLLDRRQRVGLLALQCLSVLTAFSTIGGIAAVVPFFSVLAQPQMIHRNPLLKTLYAWSPLTDERGFVVLLGIGFVAAVLLANVINLYGALLVNRYSHAVGNDWCVRLFDEYMRRDYRFHATAARAKLRSNVLYEVARLADGVLQSWLLLVANLVTTCFVVISMAWYSPAITCVALGGLGGAYAAIYLFARRRLKINGDVESRQLAQRAKLADESLAAIKEISIFGVRKLFVDELQRSCESLSASFTNTWAISQTPRLILEWLTVAGLVGLALVLSRGGTADGWLAELSFIGLATYRLLPSLQQVFVAVVRIRANQAAFESIGADLKSARDTLPKPEISAAAPSSDWSGRPRYAIRLDNVSFRYVPASPPAIQNVSLHIPAGAVVGIIGPNGSGKTTLIDIILGLLQPDSGSVHVDDVILDDSNIATWRTSVTCVPQQIALLDASVTDNIAFGLDSNVIDHDRIRHVAQLARFDEIANALPARYEERIGAGGSRLSGGQRQRLGLARALYRDSSLLLLDEATSALDGEAEHDVLTAIANLRGKKTVVLVTHRRATLKFCDVIFELRGGTLFRSGRYEDFESTATVAEPATN
jgi:HlyD family secretion protein